MSKQTGWVIAATEGATVDGRTITKAWIEDMAELYSEDEYTALIWPEHFRSSWGPFEGKNWGEVNEVKAAKYKGKLRLYVKLTANDYLLAANKDGQKLFMSIEPDVDFKGSGRCYLRGLAVTDSPASTGTTRLKFSIGENEKEHEYSQLEVLAANDFIQDSAGQTKQNRLFSMLENFFKNPEAETPPEQAEEQTMDEQQFNALMQKIDGIGTKVEELEGKVATFASEEEPGDTQEPGAGDEQEPEEGSGKSEGKAPHTGITAEQFSTLLEKVGTIADKTDKLSNDFAELKKEVPGQEPDPAGQGEAVNLV